MECLNQVFTTVSYDIVQMKMVPDIENKFASQWPAGARRQSLVSLD
jgi:hypothetical protein